MHKHIERRAFKGLNFQGWPISFPVSCVAYDFTLNNNLTSSRTFGETQTVMDLRRFP